MLLLIRIQAGFDLLLHIQAFGSSHALGFFSYRSS